MQDTESGLRSVKVNALPTQAFYSYDNFVLGCSQSSNLLVQSTCCLSLIPVQVQDLAGNNQACTLAFLESPGPQLSTINLVVIIVIVCLILAVIVSVGIIFFIRHKRAIDLQEMRVTTS